MTLSNHLNEDIDLSHSEEIQNIIKKCGKTGARKNKFDSSRPLVPVSGKIIGEHEIQLMIEASLDGWLTAGRFNRKFEKGLSDFIGCKYLITVNSGSSANLVALSALTSSTLGDRRIKREDEVITVAAGFPTTINPIIQIGAIPVFIDIINGSYNIDVNQIENSITKKTKAIILAHTLGNPFNVDYITKLCKAYNLWLVEDCCDALGSEYNGKKCGNFGDLATLSFYPAHHITMGEGGAVFTNNYQLKKIVVSIRDWGRDCYCLPGRDNTCNQRFSINMNKLGGDLPQGYDHKYIYSHLGYNLKITEMQAACGLAQLSSLNSFIQDRINNAKQLQQGLSSFNKFFILPKTEKLAKVSWFGFPITIKNEAGFTRNDLIHNLEEKGIRTRLLFAGNVTKQPYMQNERFIIHNNLKNTDFVMKNTFWVGVWPGLEYQHIQHIIECISNFIRKR